MLRIRGGARSFLVPGRPLFIYSEPQIRERKTRWDLIGVEKGTRLINMDSQIPNRVVEEWIREGHMFDHVTMLRPRRLTGIRVLICMWRQTGSGSSSK